MVVVTCSFCPDEKNCTPVTPEQVVVLPYHTMPYHTMTSKTPFLFVYFGAPDRFKRQTMRTVYRLYDVVLSTLAGP